MSCVKKPKNVRPAVLNTVPDDLADREEKSPDPPNSKKSPNKRIMRSNTVWSQEMNDEKTFILDFDSPSKRISRLNTVWSHEMDDEKTCVLDFANLHSHMLPYSLGNTMLIVAENILKTCNFDPDIASLLFKK